MAAIMELMPLVTPSQMLALNVKDDKKLTFIWCKASLKETPKIFIRKDTAALGSSMLKQII